MEHIKSIKDVIREILTGSDNVTHDLFNYLALGVAASFIGLAVYDVTVLDHAFNAQSFGLGAGGVLAGVGVALGFKPKSDTPALITPPTGTPIPVPAEVKPETPSGTTTPPLA